MQAYKATKTFVEFMSYFGIDEAISNKPQDFFTKSSYIVAKKQQKKQTNPKIEPKYERNNEAISSSKAIIIPPNIAIKQAEKLANECNDLTELKDVILKFEGCDIKNTAINTVFADSAENADIMIIGGAATTDEDKSSIPFSGNDGKLLKNMLKSIGLIKANCYLTNAIFWRPAGGRVPTTEEIAICKPFLEKHIELAKPKFLIFAGNIANKSLFNEQRTILKIHGKKLKYKDIPAITIFHPSYLIKYPLHKKLAWNDMLLLKDMLETLKE